jgi:hypothetical protein
MPLWRTLSEPCRCCPPSARCRRRFQAMASPPGSMLTAPGACRSPAALRRRGRDRSPRPKLAARSGRCGQRPAVRSRSPRPKTSRPDPRRHGQRLAVRSPSPRQRLVVRSPSPRPKLAVRSRTPPGLLWKQVPWRWRTRPPGRAVAGRQTRPAPRPLIGSRVPAPRSGAGRPATRARSRPCALTATTPVDLADTTCLS